MRLLQDTESLDMVRFLQRRSWNIFRGVIYIFPFLVLCGKDPDPRSVPALRQKALAGDSISAFYLADAYFYGKKTRKNPVLAVYWYRFSAEKGVPEAQYNLACCLESGTGCRKDPAQAFSWYEKASSGGFAPASMRLFHYYRTGIKGKEGKVIVEPSPEKALAILRDLAGKEHSEALFLLAAYGMRKDSTETEQGESFSILQKLIRKNKKDGRALRMLADCYYRGISCEKDPEKMISLLKEAAALKDPEAVAKMGFLYEQGFGSVGKDMQMALNCYRKAALMGHPAGQYKYASILLREGQNQKKQREALSWYKKAASGKYVPALCALGQIFLEGRMTRKDLRKAAEYFFQAARGGSAQAQYQLALMFRSGQINDRNDHEAAFYWFLQAALQGYVPAIHAAADCYLEGRGVERSIVKGTRFLRAAAERGDLSAQRKLQRLLRADSYAPDVY